MDYTTCSAAPSTQAFETLVRAMIQGMEAAGWSDAGTRLPGWLHEASFREVDEGERPYWFEDEELGHQANYAADVLGSALDALVEVPGIDEDQLRAGLADLCGLPEKPGPASVGLC